MQVVLSNCCNFSVTMFARTVEEVFNHVPPTCICDYCKKSCGFTLKPMYEKVSQGIFREIKYEIKLKNPRIHIKR